MQSKADKRRELSERGLNRNRWIIARDAAARETTTGGIKMITARETTTGETKVIAGAEGPGEGMKVEIENGIGEGTNEGIKERTSGNNVPVQ